MEKPVPRHSTLNIRHSTFNIQHSVSCRWRCRAARRNTIPPMKRIAALAALPLFLLACPKQEPAPAAAAAAPPMKVGLLTTGSINDGGWNAIAYEGLQQIHKELGAEISNQETRTPAEFEEGFRSYGAKGFDLAFGHGFEFQDAALKAGRQYPKTIFITTSGSSVAPNVSPMVFELEQATYLLGVI